MKLGPLTLDQCLAVRWWRNDCMETLRTPYLLTEEMQEEFYRDVCCNRDSPHRYYAIYDDSGAFVGMGGLTFIQWENRLAEISLILDPEDRGRGLGEQAVDMLLAEAFDGMGLKTVTAECYESNQSGISFWTKVADQYGAYRTTLPNRKLWNGRFWSSLYISIDEVDYAKIHPRT